MHEVTLNLGYTESVGDDGWLRVEGNGLGRWSCSCGDGSEMIAKEVANQEALAHHEINDVESAAP